MAVNTALIQFSSREIELLKKTIAPGTNNDQLALFVQVCSQLGLNPFARQIYAVMRNEKQHDGSYQKRMTIQTSIDGYRLLAQRSGEYTGQDGPYWYDAETKEWVDVWLKNEPPAAAKVGVMRRGFEKPIYAVARYATYVARDKNGNINPYTLWAKMPEVMIAKVAEALALRRAYPAELSGIYTAEEMAQADTAHTNGNTVDGSTAPTAPGIKEIYEKGREKGVWSDTAGFREFASAQLGRLIEKNAKFTPDERIELDNCLADGTVEDAEVPALEEAAS